jgi:hypothetical protein
MIPNQWPRSYKNGYRADLLKGDRGEGVGRGTDLPDDNSSNEEDCYLLDSVGHWLYSPVSGQTFICPKPSDFVTFGAYEHEVMTR